MNKVLKLFVFAVLIIFLVMFFAAGGGYHEYELNKKSNLTQEAIVRFEQDLKDGKEIDVNDYLVKEEKNYSNSFSKAGVNISNKISDFFSKGVKFIFNSIGSLIDE